MKRGIQILLSLLAVGGILAVVGWRELLDALRNITLTSLCALICYSFALIWVSCVKWRVFIRAGGSDETLPHLMKLYTIGYFFNLFTPSFVGGDAVRSYRLGNRLGSQKQALVSTFLERFTGLLAMTTLGVLFVLFGNGTTKGLELSILLVGFAAFGIAAVCFSHSVSEFTFRFLHSILGRALTGEKQERFTRLLSAIEEAFSYARGNPLLLGKALALSFVFHLLAVGNTYVAAQAVGWEAPPVDGLFVVVPLALLVGMVPITPAGIGVQEGALLYFLQRIGSTHGQGLGVGVILRAKAVLLGLLGGLLFFLLREDSDHAS